MGIVLFGAQQFLSAVHDRVTGNCSTTLLGRTNAAEMAERGYRFLNSDIKAAATRLEKGQLILSHAVFREPVKVKFPMVAYLLVAEPLRRALSSGLRCDHRLVRVVRTLRASRWFDRQLKPVVQPLKGQRGTDSSVARVTGALSTATALTRLIPEASR